MENTFENFEKEPIKLTEEALAKALLIQDKTPEWKELSLRLYLEGKGCDGFFYGVSFDKKEADDVCFEQSYKGQNLTLVVDEKTLEFTEGSIIDWGSHNDQEGFIVENPKHKRFRGKFYLRGYWKKRLEENKEPEKTH